MTAPTAQVEGLVDPLTLIGKNIKVTGTIVGTRNDVRMALQFAAQVSTVLWEDDEVPQR